MCCASQETFADSSSSLDITARCAEAQSQRTEILAPPISASHYIVNEALPSCTYSLEVHSAGRTAECALKTDSGQGMYVSKGLMKDVIMNYTVACVVGKG